MKTATLKFTDADDGTVTVEADFGEAPDMTSQAHGMANALLESVLGAAANYKRIDDPADQPADGEQAPETTEG